MGGEVESSFIQTINTHCYIQNSFTGKTILESHISARGLQQDYKING